MPWTHVFDQQGFLGWLARTNTKNSAPAQRYNFALIEFEDHDESSVLDAPNRSNAKGWLFSDRVLLTIFFMRVPDLLVRRMVYYYYPIRARNAARHLSVLIPASEKVCTCGLGLRNRESAPTSSYLFMMCQLFGLYRRWS